MNLFQLRASLTLWRNRFWFRERRLQYWRRRKNKKYVQKWERLRKEASDRISLRKKQIAEIEARRPVTMYDSVDVSQIPVNAQAAAGYVNGMFANYDAILRRTPQAKHVSITVNASGVAHCLDVETGDASPSQAPAWVRREKSRLASRGQHPILYANASTMPSVIAELGRAGISRSEYRLWVASFDHVARVPRGYDAKQYEEKSTPHVDVSVCRDSLFR